RPRGRVSSVTRIGRVERVSNRTFEIHRYGRRVIRRVPQLPQPAFEPFEAAQFLAAPLALRQMRADGRRTRGIELSIEVLLDLVAQVRRLLAHACPLAASSTE